jgi:hypothetical protein
MPWWLLLLLLLVVMVVVVAVGVCLQLPAGPWQPRRGLL